MGRLTLYAALALLACLWWGGAADAATALATNKAGDVGLCGGNATEANAQQCALQRCFQNKNRPCEPTSSCNSPSGGWVAVAALPAQTRVVLKCAGASKESAEREAMLACEKFGEGCRIMFSGFEDLKDISRKSPSPNTPPNIPVNPSLN